MKENFCVYVRLLQVLETWTSLRSLASISIISDSSIIISFTSLAHHEVQTMSDLFHIDWQVKTSLKLLILIIKGSFYKCVLAHAHSFCTNAAHILQLVNWYSWCYVTWLSPRASESVVTKGQPLSMFGKYNNLSHCRVNHICLILSQMPPVRFTWRAFVHTSIIRHWQKCCSFYDPLTLFIRFYADERHCWLYRW